MEFFLSQKWLFKLLRILFFLRHGWQKLRGNALQLKDVFTDFHQKIWQEAAETLAVEFKEKGRGFYKISNNRRETWVKDYLVEIDSFATLQVARNKPLVSSILAENGVPVPEFCVFTLDNLAQAKTFLRSQQSPCVVKPALDSAGGTGVTTNVQSEFELIRAAVFAAAFCPQIMIEQQVPGDVYRFLYLDGKLIDAICRQPPHVMGDGQSTISELIRTENARRVENAGTAALKVLVTDFDCRATLKRNGLSLKSVPENGQVVNIKSTTNESSAVECVSVLNEVDGELMAECAHAAKVVGIQLAGIDVITPDISVSLKKSGGKIIEINCSPGLHYHYQTRNPENSVRVAIPILQRLLKIPVPNGRMAFSATKTDDRISLR